MFRENQKKNKKSRISLSRRTPFITRTNEGKGLDGVTLFSNLKLSQNEEKNQEKAERAPCFAFSCKKADLQGVKVQQKKQNKKTNKAGFTATPVACGWAGAVFEVT